MQTPELEIERLPDETSKAYAARCDYLRMGADRSHRALQQKYSERSAESGEGGSPPSTRWIHEWSRRYGWVEEAKRYDEAVERYRSERQARTMEEGLALDAERVDKLKRLAEDVEAMIYQADERYPVGHPGHRPCVWVRDVKAIGSGENVQQVEIYRYNSAIVSDYRAVLDDLAKETGGRIHKADVSAREVITAINFKLGPDPDEEAPSWGDGAGYHEPRPSRGSPF